MVIKSPRDLGLVLKDRRRHLGFSQAELARRTGVTRQWVIGVERGKGSTELELVLRAARALGLVLDLQTEGSSRHPTRAERVDIDTIIDRAKGDVR